MSTNHAARASVWANEADMIATTEPIDVDALNLALSMSSIHASVANAVAMTAQSKAQTSLPKILGDAIAADAAKTEASR